MFKAPDINGPRFRKSTKSILTQEIFEKFKKSHPQHAAITFDNFRKIVRTCSRNMWETAIKERDGISLPIGGTIFIGSVKIWKKNNYDIKASIAANAPIKHRNYNTDGYTAKILYSPHLARVSGRDKSIWSFRGHRDFKRSVAKEYPKDWKKYIVPTSLYKVVEEYHKHRRKNHIKETTIKATQTYNEFDLD